MVTCSTAIETPPARILNRLLKSIKKHANIFNSNQIISKRKTLITKRPRAKSVWHSSQFRCGSYSSLSETDDQNINNSNKQTNNNSNKNTNNNNNDQLFLLKQSMDINKIRKAFVNFFLSLLWKYTTYVKFEEIEQMSEEDQFLLNLNDIFDSEGFLKNCSEDIVPYLKKFIQSQMFIYFLQESLNPEFKETFFCKALKNKSIRHYKRYLQIKMQKEKVSGFIQKQGKFRHSWKKRFFELENRELRYYHVVNYSTKKEKKKFRGKIIITPGKTKFLIPYKTDTFPTDYAFILKNENREWKLCCENYNEFKKWIISIRAESFNDEEIKKIRKKLMAQVSIPKKCQDLHHKKTSCNLLQTCMNEKNMSTRFIGTLCTEEGFEMIKNCMDKHKDIKKKGTEKGKLHNHLFDSLHSHQIQTDSDSSSSPSSPSSSSSSSTSDSELQSDSFLDIDEDLKNNDKNDDKKIENNSTSNKNNNKEENPESECDSKSESESESDSKLKSTKDKIKRNQSIKTKK
ncbi:sesquipedalian [Anaeramoeba flamelloides]|uniref:Sesquipedalian n=1 Tax=Anaeramoeba flamelloides TaxID=1746091 RepID=A0AAV7ZKR7_9EUKA|nr:sesquipedalian [Anaeramoeba flamelloides]